MFGFRNDQKGIVQLGLSYWMIKLIKNLLMLISV